MNISRFLKYAREGESPSGAYDFVFFGAAGLRDEMLKVGVGGIEWRDDEKSVKIHSIDETQSFIDFKHKALWEYLGSIACRIGNIWVADFHYSQFAAHSGLEAKYPDPEELHLVLRTFANTAVDIKQGGEEFYFRMIAGIKVVYRPNDAYGTHYRIIFG